MTRMAGPDCTVMYNLISIYKYTHTHDGNESSSGDGNGYEDGNGDGNENGIGEGGGEIKKRKKPHKSCRHGGKRDRLGWKEE